jgi:hypothetical protein
MTFGYNTIPSIQPVQITIDQKLEYVEYINYLASLRTSDARCAGEIKSRIAMAKAALNKKTHLTSKLNFN